MEIKRLTLTIEVIETTTITVTTKGVTNDEEPNDSTHVRMSCYACWRSMWRQDDGFTHPQPQRTDQHRSTDPQPQHTDQHGSTEPTTGD